MSGTKQCRERRKAQDPEAVAARGSLMPSKGRRNHPVGHDPYQALNRCIVQLKVRVASQRASASSAAAELEGCISCVEAGPPALHLAVSQATRAGALVHQEQARQLSADASTLLQSLGNTQDITAGSAWPLLRPLLRLLLWLLPEHVPLPLTDAAMSQSQPSETGQSRHSTAAPTAVGQWRQEVASSYVQAVVTQPLASTVLHALGSRMPGLPFTQAGAVPVNSHGFRIVEECLAWFTVLSRLCVVAMEQEHDSGLPRPAGVTRGCLTFRDSSLFDFLIPRLTRIVPHLVNLARPVSYWLRGRFELASRLGLVPGSESSKEQAEEFAAVFVPSPHMASATGLWGEAPPLLKRLSDLVCQMATQGFSNLVKGRSSPLMVAWFHGEMVCWSTGPFSLDAAGMQRLELSRHLAFKLKMHLRGLALMYRALPAKSAQEPGPRPPLRSAVLSIELGAVTAVRGAYIRDIRTQDGLTSLMYLGPLPGTAQVTHPSVLWTSMQNSDSTWPSRVQRPSKSDEEWAKEWQGTAVAAAEAARLLMHINGQSLSISERAKAADTDKALMDIALRLMPVLRPASAESFASPWNAAVSTAWASCLSVILDAHQVLQVRADLAGNTDCREGDTIALAALLDQALPVLDLVAAAHSPAKPREGTTDPHAPQLSADQTLERRTAAAPAGDTAGFSSSSPPQGSGQLQNNTHAGLRRGSEGASTSGQVPSSVTDLSSSSNQGQAQQALSQSAGQSEPDDRSAGAQWSASTQPAVPVTTTLSLLGAASNLLLRCALAECSVKAPPSSESAMCLGRSHNMADALDMCLCLSYAVTYDPAAWEQAKAQAPLLLIEALYRTTLSLCGTLSQAAAWWSKQMLTRFQGRDQQSCMSLWKTILAWACPGAAGGTQVHTATSSTPATNITRDNNIAAITANATPGFPPAVSATTTAAAAAQQQRSITNADVTSNSSNVVFGRQNLHCPTLVCELTLKLWSLYADKAIVGGTSRPASWLPDAERCGQDVYRALVSMLHRLDHCVATFITMQHDNPSADNGNDGRRTVARLLASLTPAVPWACNAFQILSDEHRAALRLQLCSIPLIRVVCMLSSVGLLTKEQEQGVVALLGGTPRQADASGSSTSIGSASESSFFLLPEPASVVEARERRGLSLADVFDWLLWFEVAKLPDSKWAAETLTDELLWAFRTEQLPVIACAKEEFQAHKGSSRLYEKLVVRLYEPLTTFWRESTDTYLCWMQATLLSIISEVLSRM